MQETRVRSLGQEVTLEKEIATHSSILAWRTPWTEESVGYSPWGRKVLSPLGPGAHQTLCAPFKSGIPVVKLHWPSEAYSLGIPPPIARPPRLGSLTWGSELSLLWGNLCGIIIF